MSFFHFIDTIFFVSLGITFVLISFLVYHFKERLNVIETKTDTMFQIVNNVVHELKNIKTMVLLSQRPPMYVPYTNPLTPVHEEGDEEDEDEIEEIDEIDEYQDQDPDEVDHSNKSSENLVKVIHIDDSVEIPEIDDSVNEIVVHKLEKSAEAEAEAEAETEASAAAAAAGAAAAAAEDNGFMSNTTSLYKLSVQALRDLALSKGLITESNKMKKSDLIALLSQS